MNRPTSASSDRVRNAPPLRRGAMTPAPWFGFWRGLLFALWPGPRWSHVPRPWQRVARQRRGVLLALLLAIAGAALALRLGDGAAVRDALWWSTTALTTLLVAWVGVGAAAACVGAWALRRGDPMSPRPASDSAPIDPDVRTAIVMPICNEDVVEVFAGLRATCESLAATGEQGRFDVFVLSDTSDPALARAELHAWQRLRAMLGEGGRLVYRRRKRRVQRKAGNVADFCRRWGRGYRYMVVLDADSTMSGDALLALVRLMERRPRAGIIQTLPQIARPATLHARAQQFASRVSGRLIALGMAWWQLGDAHYWGHNAIIRVEPFMRHCGLARLPGRGALAGEILSHDFVEAALMGRAGYEVWLAPQLEGSWECSPSNLLDELQRDRRWCQGNLQNARLIAEPGWRAAHRAMFAVGALSYAVAPLWLLFIVLGAAGGGLARGDASLWLLAFGLLLLPRALGVAAIVARGEAHAFGGVVRLAGGTLLELLMSTLQAPLRMLAHSLYVLGALSGLKLQWKSPPRAANALGWSDALSRVGVLVALPLALGWGLMRRAAAFSLEPMLLPWLLAVPLTVLTGHPRSARAAARLGLLRTPEESAPPRPLLRAGEHAGFADLGAAPRVDAMPPRSRRGALPVTVTAAIAVLVAAMPRPGVAPELPPQWRAGNEVVLSAYWVEPAPAAPAPRKRVVRSRPARMIDDAVRQRALDAVHRSLASDAPPA